MSPDDEQAQYAEGVRLFNAGQFFEAHEAWENAWRGAEGLRREFFQGLIQCAVALEHFRRGNALGAARLRERFERRFAGVPSPFMGLDVARFLDGMREALQHDRPSPPEASANVVAAPTIVLFD